jgi:putative proteasome-type protease
MTYCCGVRINEGLVFASDSRTNAGIDHVATFRKLVVFEKPGDRIMCLMSAGNLATTQGVVARLNQQIKDKADRSLFTAKTMYDATRHVAQIYRDILDVDSEHVRAQNADPGSDFIFGGQIKGDTPHMAHIYSAGNFIETTPETPFLQIGETKYGKPIMDRVIQWDISLGRATKGALISFDSTMRSNLSVGLPIDVLTYRTDSFKIGARVTIRENDPYFSSIRKRYGKALYDLFGKLPEPDWVK